MNYETKVKQEIFFDENGELKVKTACGISDGITQQAYFNDELSFEADNDTVMRLLAERNKKTFLPVENNLHVMSSDEDVNKFVKHYEEVMEEATKNFDETIQKYEKFNQSNEQHLQSCEKALQEKNEQYEHLVMQVKCYNAMPFWKRIFKKFIL